MERYLLTADCGGQTYKFYANGKKGVIGMAKTIIDNYPGLRCLEIVTEKVL